MIADQTMIHDGYVGVNDAMIADGYMITDISIWHDDRFPTYRRSIADHFHGRIKWAKMIHQF